MRGRKKEERERNEEMKGEYIQEDARMCERILLTVYTQWLDQLNRRESCS